MLVFCFDASSPRYSIYHGEIISRENYLFTCECERCVSESNQADVTSDEDEELEEDDDDDYEDIEGDGECLDESEPINENEQSMEN